MHKNAYTIITYPSPVLRKVSAAIPKENLDSLKNLISDMAEIMKKNDGVGLAAPQIGKNIQLALVFTKEGILPLINPKIKKQSLLKILMEEGCLSLPGVFGMVKRSKKITIETMNLKGGKVNITAFGFFARTILHEMDHLNGILFIDKVKKITKGNDLLKEYESRKKD